MRRIKDDYNFFDDLTYNLVMTPVFFIGFLILLTAILSVYAYIILPVIEFFKYLLF